jgi:hypothetical protein
LFGDSEEDRMNNMGLLGLMAGGGILSANQPGISTGQALGQGFAGAGTNMMQMQKMRQQAQQMKMMDDYRKAMMEQGKQRMVPNSVREYEYALDNPDFSAWKESAGAHSNPSAPIQNFNQRQKLVEQYGDDSKEVKVFDNYVRSLPFLNTGPSFVQPGVAGSGTTPAVIGRGLNPGEQPKVREEQAAAHERGAAIGARETGVSPGQKAIDDAFGKEYATIVAGGGMADPEKNLAQLDAIRGRLEASSSGKSGESLTGPILGRVPDAVKSFTNPSSLDVKQQVEDVVQRNLRTVLGAQFTENEGTRLIERAYNPSLDEKTNAMRLGRLTGALRKGLQAKIDAAKYFESNGTLFGYEGAKQFTLDDIEREAGLSARPGASGGWSIKRVD